MSKKTRLIALFFLLPCFIFSKETQIASLFRETLSNGLEVFVMENHAAPLAYIEIAVRAGAVTQQPENAGLFHLYEHLMFKGNAKYKNQKEFTEAMNKLGVGDWNGTTGVDRVNYFFTVPSSSVREGIEFWSYAIRTPKIDKTELEREKDVVLSEINAEHTQPSRIRSAAFLQKMFPDSPWRLDPSGDPDVVKNATVEQLREIQNEFYVPENAALFVGGDVRHEEIFKIAKSVFGNWKNAKTNQTFTPSKKEKLKNPIKLVFADPSSSNSFVQVSYFLQGPNGETDFEDTYAADVWASVIDAPDSIFNQTFLENKKLEIVDSDYISGSYLTRRDSGLISITVLMKNEGSLSSVEKSEEFYKTVREKLTKEMTSKDFPKNISEVEKRIKDMQIYAMETAEGVLSSLSYFFTAVNADYFFDYDERLSNVTAEEVQDFVKKYIQNQDGILLVSVSEEEFEKRKLEFEKAGYEKINAESAFWWKEGKK